MIRAACKALTAVGLVGLALCAPVAHAGQNSVIIQGIRFAMTPQDTTEFMAVDSLVNDSMWYYTPTWRIEKDFNHILGQIVQTTADTATATGLAADSVIFTLQTKINDDSADTWFTVWSSPLIPVASFDTSGGYARGAASVISIDADSMGSCFDLWRMRVDYIAEEDSVLSAAYLGYGVWGDSSTVLPYARFSPRLIYRQE